MGLETLKNAKTIMRTIIGNVSVRALLSARERSKQRWQSEIISGKKVEEEYYHLATRLKELSDERESQIEKIHAYLHYKKFLAKTASIYNTEVKTGSKWPKGDALCSLTDTPSAATTNGATTGSGLTPSNNNVPIINSKSHTNNLTAFITQRMTEW